MRYDPYPRLAACTCDPPKVFRIPARICSVMHAPVTVCALGPIGGIARQVGQPCLEESHLALRGLQHDVVTMHHHHELQTRL